MSFAKYAALVLFIISPFPSYAADLSLLSGFYRTQEDDPGYKSQEISLGGRYGLEPSAERVQWFLELSVASTSYSGNAAPDGSSSLSVGGGQIHFLRNFAKGVHSFVSWFAGLENSTAHPNLTTETKTNALVYSANVGFRFDISRSLFFNIEAILFNSALQSTSETTDSTNNTTTKTTRTELYADTFSGAESLRFGIGMLF